MRIRYLRVFSGVLVQRWKFGPGKPCYSESDQKWVGTGKYRTSRFHCRVRRVQIVLSCGTSDPFVKVMLDLPQVIMIGIILATYPSSSDPVFYTTDTPSSSVPPTENSILWQSIIQCIQNLMGATWVTTPLLFLFYFSPDKSFNL